MINIIKKLKPNIKLYSKSIHPNKKEKKPEVKKSIINCNFTTIVFYKSTIKSKRKTSGFSNFY